MTREMKRLVQSPDKIRWYYLENVRSAEHKTDLTLEIDAIISRERILAKIEELEMERLYHIDKNYSDHYHSGFNMAIDQVSKANDLRIKALQAELSKLKERE